MIQGFRPLYQQVQELLLDRISGGQWQPGEMLPAEPKLAEEFGVSPGTVRKALDRLAQIRLVERRQGRGTFVTEQTPDHSLFRFYRIVDQHGHMTKPESRLLRIRPAKPTARQRELLQLDSGNLWKLERIRLVYGKPTLNQSVFLPQERFPGLDQASELPNTLYAFYQAKYGVTIHKAEETLRAASATASDARNLGVEVGLPILELERVAFDLQGQPVELRFSHIHTHQFAYKVVLR